MLGSGNEAAAREALAAWPGGLQIGGGIQEGNAKEWMKAGAEKVRFTFNVTLRYIINHASHPKIVLAEKQRRFLLFFF